MANIASLKSTYDIDEINVRSSAQISGKVTAVTAKLANDDNNNLIVALKAQGSTVNKLISIVEIAKRQFKLQNTQIYQYTSLSSELITIERKRPVELENDESDAFDSGDSTKKRAVPVLTIYLSRQSVAALRSQYT